MGAIGVQTDTSGDLSLYAKKVKIFTLDMCCFKDGLLTIASNDGFLNSSNVDYHCEVL